MADGNSCWARSHRTTRGPGQRRINAKSGRVPERVRHLVQGTPPSRPRDGCHPAAAWPDARAVVRHLRLTLRLNLDHRNVFDKPSDDTEGLLLSLINAPGGDRPDSLVGLPRP